MKKIKLAIVYQVIFHYRIPFYKEIEEDVQIDSILLHGSGIKNSKLQNASHNLEHTSKLFTVKLPFKQNNQKKYFSFFPFLFFNLISINPDVILLEGASSIINNLSTYFYAKIFGKKIIFWSLGRVQNKKLSSIRKKVDFIIKLLEKKADAIFTYSSLGESYFLSRGIPKERIFKAVNVLDTRKILQVTKPKHENNEFRVLFIGHIIPEKKLEILIEAFIKLAKSKKQVYLDIIGSGSDYYSKLVSTYKVKNLVFHGRITDNLSSFYNTADVFVLPGLGGLAISESMAYGVPVVCSIADGTEKDLINSDSGVIIQEMSVDALYNALNDLHEDRDRLKQMGTNAKQRIKTIYSFENYYNTFVKCLDYVYES